MRPWLSLVLPALIAITSTDWPSYGGGPTQTRYSPLTQINAENVASLKVAWTYDTGDAFKGSEMQCQPVVAHGVMYAASPKLRVFALDAASGALKWSFDPFAGEATPSRTRLRGLMFWERGDDRRIYFAARQWLYALDATTGRPIPSFGQQGRIDLREGFEGRDPRAISVGMNTPGVFYGDLLILGSLVPEGLPSAPGDIRAFNVFTGKQVWVFHTIPHPGELGYDTWPKDAWKYSGGANTWGEITVDEKRGIAYFPTGSPTYDYYGADRIGTNLFANCLLALDARTGKRLWHFQNVHHDLWDFDNNAAPQLTKIKRDGKEIDVVAMAGKTGFLYVFDRVTGAPMWPIEERPVPKSEMPGEQSWPTQPFPTNPPPFVRQAMTMDDIDPHPLITDVERAAFR